MGDLSIRATGLKQDLDKLSAFIEKKSEDTESFDLMSESKDYPQRDSKEFRRYFEIRFDSLLEKETD